MVRHGYRGVTGRNAYAVEIMVEGEAKMIEQRNRVRGIEIQTEDYVKPISTRPSKIRQKQAMLLYPVTIKKISHDRDEADNTEASWAPI